MSDCSPLRLNDHGQSSSSPSQSLTSHNSEAPLDRRQPQGKAFRNRPVDSTSGDASHHYHRSGNHRNNQRSPPSPSEMSTSSCQLKYGAKSVIDLFIPVSICIWIVVGTMKATDSYHYSSQSVIWYAQMMFTDQTVGTETRVWHSLLNALIMLALIVCMTTLLIVLYKFRCYKTIYVWLLLSSMMLLLPFMVMYIAVFLKVYNVTMDKVTLTIFIWNFAAVGMICIHWKGPLKLQQAYLIMISALMALVFIQCLPDWTVWSVLVIVSVWDLVAVLCPMGPLRILVELAQERDEPIFPALIYSSTMIWELSTLTAHSTFTMADNKNSNNRQIKARNTSRPNHRLTSSSTPSESPKRPNRLRDGSEHFNSPIRRSDQHPVEIEYEDGVEPPSVSIIQPNSIASELRREDEWSSAGVRAVRARNTNSRAQKRSAPQVNTMQHGVNSSAIDFSQSVPNECINETQPSEDDERGVKLGLGDFIFFSVLVGKASSYGDWTITMSCYVSVLVGLCLTLSLLTLLRKALPALPISIGFGLTSALLSYFFAVPLASDLTVYQIFV